MKKWAVSVCLLAGFAIWTIAVMFVDAKAIGPNGTAVGFASLNGFVHRITGVHMRLYDITDWLSVIPLGFIMGAAAHGLIQWIRKRSIRKVDRALLLLGAFYIVVLSVYIFFSSLLLRLVLMIIDLPEFIRVLTIL